jgi:DNA (cytosine-5)-methyltransferase 1
VSDLTAVSLFAGIGGFDRALQSAGVHMSAAVEIDKDCRGVLRRQFPETTIFNDVTEVTGDQLRAAGFVPGRGIITGGFPCQDLSIAGRRAGLGGARSGLFWQIMRLADELQPRWLLLENVPGLLSAVCPCPGDDTCTVNGRALQCGEWRGPREHRVWFPNVPHQVRGGACPGGCMPAHGGAMGTVLGALGKRGYGFAYRVLDAQFFGVPQRRERVFIAGCLGDWAAPAEVLLEPESGDGHSAARGQAREGAPGGTEGDAGVPRIAHALTAREGKGADSDATSGFVVTTLQGGGKRGHRIDAEGAAGGHLVPVIPLALRGREGGSAAECGEPGDPAFTVRTPGGGSSYPMIAHALTSEGADASEDGTGRGTPLVTVPVAADAAVRRLTPRECERLQGFPDDWTRWQDDGAEQSDSVRYRQLGNAVAVPVVEWIARRVVAVDGAAESEAAA